MAGSNTLNAKNLEALGAERLAELLMELCSGNATVKRQLRLALAGAKGPGSAAKEIRKRLAEIARARRYLDWRDIKPLATELEAQRLAIAAQVAPGDPALALELGWRFMELTESVFARADDSNGVLGDIFRAACADLGGIAASAKPDPESLAAQVFAAIQANDYGQFDGLIATMAPALGPKGLARLKQLVVEMSETPVERPAERKVIGWGSVSGKIYEDDVKERSRKQTVKVALQAIADAHGDVDAYIAQYDAKTRKVAGIAAKIAQRLLTAGRAEEALRTLDAIEPGRPNMDWEDARIAVLDALGRGVEAQAARWSCFERFLSARHLREHLKRLKGFDDVEAEERALDHAGRFKEPYGAMMFLLEWPALERLAAVVTERADALDGNAYEILTPVAHALAGKFPLAASLALRPMIDFTLRNARSTRFGYAARHLKECESLAGIIEDFGGFERHEDYVRKLRDQHGKKAAFWDLV